MNFTKALSFLFVFAIVCALVINHATNVEAGKKKMLKKAALAAMMLKSGKKILLPLPIPIPIP